MLTMTLCEIEEDALFSFEQRLADRDDSSLDCAQHAAATTLYTGLSGRR